MVVARSDRRGSEMVKGGEKRGPLVGRPEESVRGAHQHFVHNAHRPTNPVRVGEAHCSELGTSLTPNRSFRMQKLREDRFNAPVEPVNRARVRPQTVAEVYGRRPM